MSFAAVAKKIPLSEVARHCVPEDCWVAVNGKVYDLSEFMCRHPGGPTTITSWAGKDASEFFNKIHKGIKTELYLRPEAIVGDLGLDEKVMSEEAWHDLRKARIQEVKEELEQVSETGVRRASSVSEILLDKKLDAELKGKLQSLETQKRVALDVEDFPKAAEVEKSIASLLATAKMMIEKTPAPKTSVGVPLSEVARHNKPHDCWIAVNRVVYDMTDVLIEHPDQRNQILAWTGRDATPMWNKIPGRFPSKTWFDFYSRPEFQMFEVSDEAPLNETQKKIQQLNQELHRLEGPSEEDISAHKLAAQRVPPTATQMSTVSEETRFPRLREIAAAKELPFFTRAEVAKHTGPPGGPPGTEPYMIVHNKVYDLTPLLGVHPGGDELLLTRAGTDATKEFEVFEHSEKARVRRETEMLVGLLGPGECTDWTAENEAEGGEVQDVKSGGASNVELYLRHKVVDAVLLLLGSYVYRSYNHRKPLSKLMYSRGLRHMHLIMAVGIFTSLASAHAAGRSEGLTKKKLLAFHKQTGVAILLALFVRIFFRLRSGIPPRFPGNHLVQLIETQSLRAFYLMMFVLPVSGIANEYYLKWAPGAEQTGVKTDDEKNNRLAHEAITVHKSVAKVFEYLLLPFHLGYTTAYHYSKGRGVIRKVSPFI